MQILKKEIRLKTKTTEVNPRDYKPHPKNPNKHPDSQVAGIADSLEEFGQYKNAVVWESPQGEKFILAGHALFQAAKLNGKETIEVKDYSHLSEQDAIALMMADIITPNQGEVDSILLASLVRGFDDPLTIPGVDGNLLAGLLGGEWDGDGDALGGGDPPDPPDPQINRGAELAQEYGVELGQTWVLDSGKGVRHLLTCGDCTDKAVVGAIAENSSISIAITSPPYAMQRKDTYGGITEDKYIKWWFGVQNVIADLLIKNGSFFVNIKPHSNDNGERSLYVFDLVLSMVRKWGWRFIDEYCWRNSRNGVPGAIKSKFKNAFEPIYHFSNGTPLIYTENDIRQPWKESGIKRLQKLSDRDLSGRVDSNSGSGFNTDRTKFDSSVGALPSNVLEFSSEANKNNHHPAPFPAKLPEFFIKAFTMENENVFEPFSGSGTTLCVCEELGRNCRACEISPEYVAVALYRWQQMTGITPTLL